MSQATNLQALRQPAPAEVHMPAVAPGFGSLQSFELMQRAAKLLSSSTLVPASYRAFDEKKGDNPNALANCVVALNMSQRMGADPLMVMQNLYIVEGRPSWSSQWIIAAINGCGRFSPLRFELKDLGEKEVEYSVTEWVNRERQVRKLKAAIRNQQCIAWAVEQGTAIPKFDLADLKAHGGLYGCCKHYGIPLVESPPVSMEMAVKEGWYGKSGSKWQTMPEVMLRYRTASFFGKLYAPEILMGLQSVEEAHDVIDMSDVLPAQGGGYTVTSDELRQPAAQATQAPAKAEAKSQPPADDEPPFDVDTTTGEVTQQDAAGGQASMFGLQDALAAVKSGDLDTARDIARSLSEKDQQIVEQTIANASQPTGTTRQRRQRDLADME